MQNYIQKRLKNQRFAEFVVSHVSDISQDRIKTCGDFIAMIADAKLEKKKLHKGSFCGNRFCPMCAWRKAKKDALKIAVLMKYLQAEHLKEFIFLTLTAPNVPADQLADEITRFNHAFAKLTKRKEVLPVIKGYVRKLEVTYNADRDNYHAHFHVLVAVNKSYFTDKTYIRQSEWLRIWQDVMGDDRITQVHVEKVGQKSGSSAINEVAKYAAKDEEYLTSKKIFDVFYNALKGRQVLVYNGLFADANRLYKNGELDKLKLVDQTEYVYMLLYSWGRGEYVEAEKRELTEEERKKVNRQLIDEKEIADD